MDKSITSDEILSIKNSFQSHRQMCATNGIMKSPMYIVTSYNRSNGFQPILWDHELSTPELSLLVKAASMTCESLTDCLSTYDDASDEYESIESLSKQAQMFVTHRFNVVLRFQSDLIKTETTISGLTPSYALLQSFKNTPVNQLSMRNLIVR